MVVLWFVTHSLKTADLDVGEMYLQHIFGELCLSVLTRAFFDVVISHEISGLDANNNQSHFTFLFSQTSFFFFLLATVD